MVLWWQSTYLLKYFFTKYLSTRNLSALIFYCNLSSFNSVLKHKKIVALKYIFLISSKWNIIYNLSWRRCSLSISSKNSSATDISLEACLFKQLGSLRCLLCLLFLFLPPKPRSADSLLESADPLSRDPRRSRQDGIPGLSHFPCLFISLSLIRNASVTFLPRRPSPVFLKSLRPTRRVFRL